MRKSIKHKIVIFIFIISLTLPSVTYPFVKQYLDINNYENREFNQCPTLDYTTVIDYPTLYENYYNDYLPYKNQFIKFKNLIDLKVFKHIDNENVILGRDNWLFYSGEDKIAINEYKAEMLYSDSQLEAILKKVLKYRENITKQTKSEFVLMLIPDKEHVYSEYLPNYLQGYSSFKRIDQVYEYITSHSDIKVCYPYKNLIDSKEKYQVYYKYDTHWNDMGAYIGSNSLLELLGHYKKQNTEIYKKHNSAGDLAKMCYLTDYLDDETNYQLKDNDDIILKQIYNNNLGNLSLVKYESSSQNNQTIYFIGDSFRNAMQQYLSKYFTKSCYVHRGAFDKADYLNEDPDVVVYQLVERYLNLLETLEY